MWKDGKTHLPHRGGESDQQGEQPSGFCQEWIHRASLTGRRRDRVTKGDGVPVYVVRQDGHQWQDTSGEFLNIVGVGCSVLLQYYRISPTRTALRSSGLREATFVGSSAPAEQNRTRGRALEITSMEDA